MRRGTGMFTGTNALPGPKRLARFAVEDHPCPYVASGLLGAADCNAGGDTDEQAHLAAPNSHDAHFDVRADLDRLIGPTGQYKHVFFSSRSARAGRGCLGSRWAAAGDGLVGHPPPAARGWPGL